MDDIKEDINQNDDPKEPKIFKHPEEPKEKPKNQNWEPIDVSRGIYRGKDLLVNKQSFERHIRDDLKGDLKFSKRNELAKGLSAKRGNKLTKTEVREAIKGMEDKGTISHLKARQLRTKFGARSSSLF